MGQNLKETTRQQNIKQRQKQANERRMMREYETASAKLFELAFAYGEGRPITAVEKSVLYSENLPLFTAAEAKRTGHNIVFVELLRANDDVYRVWGENAYSLNAATKGREYATAVVNEAGEAVSGVGWGSWPAARPEDVTGYRYGLKHGQGGAIKSTIIPTAPLHNKVIRLCNQILTEATAGHSLLILTIEGNEWGKVKERWKKRDGARYCAIPQGGGAFAVIHNQAKEGGESIAEGTFGYSKGELYAAIRPLVENQRNIIGRGNQRIQRNEDFGGDYRGARGDGRKKEAKEGQRFSITGLGSFRKAAGLLGMSLSTRGYGGDVLKDANEARAKIQLLVDASLLEALTAEKLASLDAFLAESERRKAEAEAEFPTYAHKHNERLMCISRENEAGPTAVGEPIFPNGRIRRAQNCIVEVAI